jgi:hypothetical protein
MSLKNTDIRIIILERLAKASPFTVSIPVLRAALKHERVQLEAPELAAHLSALADASLASVENDPLDESARCWRLTERGRNYLASL